MVDIKIDHSLVERKWSSRLYTDVQPGGVSSRESSQPVSQSVCLSVSQ